MFALPVSAQTAVSDKVINELSAFGILLGDENGGLNLQNSVTRVEFCAMVTRMLKINAFSAGGGAMFNDVGTDDWFYNDINTLTQLKIVDGAGDGSFYPNNPVSLDEACKMLIVSLGYGFIANEKGGYPTGYKITASEIGILRGISFSGGEITRADLAQMVYNCLGIELIEPVYKDGAETYRVSDKTLRDMHLYSNGDGSFVSGVGIVEANYKTWLVKPYPNLEPDEVVIDGVIVKTGGTNAADCLGMEIKYYASSDIEGGVYTLKLVAATENNSVVNISDYDYEGSDGSDIRYDANNASNTIRTLNLSSGYALVRNNRIILSPVTADFELERGSVSLIDNNGDRLYDVLIIKEFESVIIAEIDKDIMRLKTTTPYNGIVAFKFDPDSEIHYFLKNADGLDIELSDVEAGSVASIFADYDRQIFEFIVNDKTIESVVDEYTELDGIAVINGTEYTVEKNRELEIRVGYENRFFLNYRNEIAFADEIRTVENYGYIIETTTKFTLADNGKVKMLVPGEYKVEVVYDDTVEYDEGTSVLKAGNSEVRVLPVASKVNVGGTKVGAEDFMKGFTSDNRLVKYKTNSDGEIKEIDYPETEGQDIFDGYVQRTFNAKENVFGMVSDEVKAFGVTEDTRVLCVPSNSVNNDDDYLAKVELSDKNSYYINGYDCFTDSKNVKLVVVKASLNYNVNAPPKFALVEKLWSAVDAGGEIVTKAALWNEGKRQEFTLDDASNIPAVRAGDAIQYRLGANSGLIADIIIFASLGNNAQLGNVGHSDKTSLEQSRSYCGYPISVEYDAVDHMNARWVNNITLCFNAELTGEYVTVSINKNNAPPVYVLNGNTGVEPGDVRDIYPVVNSPEGQNKVFIYSDNNGVQMVVIV
jgi:hypothetical protein